MILDIFELQRCGMTLREIAEQLRMPISVVRDEVDAWLRSERKPFVAEWGTYLPVRCPWEHAA